MIEKSSAIKIEHDFDFGYIGYYLKVNEKYYNMENGSLIIKRISNFTEIEKFKLEVYFQAINISYEINDNTIIVYP